MKHRYDNWVGGLNGDWLISRQRFFGIPFPVWYPLDDDGEPDHDHPLLPVRGPSCRSTRRREAPHGYTEDQRGKPGGFVGDPDVMDTWATSSLTPADRRHAGRSTTTCSRASSPTDLRHPGARHHPHLAVLPRRPRRTSRTTSCPGRTR